MENYPYAFIQPSCTLLYLFFKIVKVFSDIKTFYIIFRHTNGNVSILLNAHL
jgi:hypothetical protein